MRSKTNTPMGTSQVELNEQFKKALDVMENTSKNVFITGKAGTGKSTLLNYFRTITRKKVVVLAPTGVAALNVQGETIHSFFGFKPDITLQKVRKLRGKKVQIFKEIDAIIIDEVSMVRADLLDCMDRFLRLNGRHSRRPFGGIEMLFIGDLYQLPPVVTGKEREIFKTHYQSAYFFGADVFKEFFMEFIELEKIYRQKDEVFINLLNAIRNNSITEENLSMLNKRVGAKFSTENQTGYVVHLTTTNKMAAEINAEHLHKLKTNTYTYRAQISGDFKENSYPTDSELHLGVDAQVMLLNNDAKGRWVNGSIGKVTDIKHNEKKDIDIISVQLADNRIEEILPYTWEIFHFTFNENTHTIETETVGSFTQYPLKLAWAITIHKSQGKTFERVIIDIGKGTFAYGQTYVALSRCTSFEGIVLTKPIKKSHIFMDWHIVQFVTKYQYVLSERDVPLEEKLNIIKQAIEKGASMEILYLKSSDEKTRRVIRPYDVGKKMYLNKPFTGVEAYCMKRKEDRVFRVDRILEMKLIDNSKRS